MSGHVLRSATCLTLCHKSPVESGSCEVVVSATGVVHVGGMAFRIHIAVYFGTCFFSLCVYREMLVVINPSA